MSVLQGWQCPICKHVFAPHVNECAYCGRKEKALDGCEYYHEGRCWGTKEAEPCEVVKSTPYCPKYRQTKLREIDNMEASTDD